jgi:hypothetical protein
MTRLTVTRLATPALLSLLPALAFATPLRRVGWGSGERITYRVAIAGLEGGRVAMSVGRPARRGKTLRIRALGQTIPLISSIKRMQEELISLVNLVGLLPRHTTSDRIVGDESRVVETEFRRLVHQRVIKGHRRFQGRRKIRGHRHDALSALFTLRSMRLRKGDRFKMRILAGTALWDVQVTVVGRERIYTRRGGRDTLRVDGVGRRILDDGRLAPGFKQRKLSIWFSRDRRRVPLRLVGETKFGQVEGNLSSYRPPPRGGVRVRVAALRVERPPPRAQKRRR